MMVLRKLGIVFSLFWLFSGVLVASDAVAFSPLNERTSSEEEREIEESNDAFELAENVKKGSAGAGGKNNLHFDISISTSFVFMESTWNGCFMPFRSPLFFNDQSLAERPSLYLVYQQQVFYERA
jgi:hypothetical protein